VSAVMSGSRLVATAFVLGFKVTFQDKKDCLFSVKILTEDSEFCTSIFREFSRKITPCVGCYRLLWPPYDLTTLKTNSSNFS